MKKKTIGKRVTDRVFFDSDIFISENEIDFHLLGVLSPYDIEKYLYEFIEDNYIAGNRFLLAITGKGKVVKPIVKKLLKQNKLVESFKQAGYFNGQSGAFEITLKN